MTDDECSAAVNFQRALHCKNHQHHLTETQTAAVMLIQQTVQLLYLNIFKLFKVLLPDCNKHFFIG